MTVRYLPRDLVSDLADESEAITNNDAVVAMRRLVERAFAEGYEEGYVRGRRDSRSPTAGEGRSDAY